jgi:hypothetical protein
MEKLYQYLWKNRMTKSDTLHLVDGKKLVILDPGLLNNDSGPDFFNAKIMIDDIEWVGNIEIHVKASDWYRHHHDTDAAYDNVILHVVADSDTLITRSNGTTIPQAVLTLPSGFLNTYASLTDYSNFARCASRLNEIPELTKEDWLETLAIERLQERSNHINDIMQRVNGNRQQTLFVTLARALGFGLNADPLEMLALSVPLNHIGRHSDNPLQIEAILFGQAGMLDPSLHLHDEYYQTLCREYAFLSRKYSLRPLRSSLWKYARTRPQNTPCRRIAFLARLLRNGFSLVDRIIDPNADTESLRNIFSEPLDGYWSNHFSFGAESPDITLSLGVVSIDLLIINAVVPFIYNYGATMGQWSMEERAMDILRELRAERNNIIRQWENAGLHADNAMRSQALLQLHKRYCDTHKCLYCRFGNTLLRKNGQ